jgi:glycosyltransferase involved in cell wall biosynthesis
LSAGCHGGARHPLAPRLTPVRLHTNLAPIIDTFSSSSIALAPTALFASTQHWNSVFQVGSHHIARCFAARGWRVGFLSAPISPWHLAGFGADARARAASWRSGGQRDPESGVWHHVPFAPLPWGAAPLIRGRGAVRLAWWLSRPSLAMTLRRAGFDRPRLAYTDHFLHEGLLQAARPALTVFRRADNLAGFPGAGADFAAREVEFARRADLTLCTTRSSGEHMARLGVQRTQIVHNGIRLERFFGDAPTPDEYRGDARPIVVYVGAAEHRVDIELMLRGVTELRHLRWVVIGPFAGVAGERLRAAGALVLGSRPHEQLAGYLQHAHVGIVPFSLSRHAELIREVSPLKVVEYAACGLPVVGTLGCQYPTGLPTPLAVCRTPDEFLDAVRMFAAGPRPVRPGIEQFASWSWEAQLAPLFEWLENERPDSQPVGERQAR